jgi:MFS family permease
MDSEAYRALQGPCHLKKITTERTNVRHYSQNARWLLYLAPFRAMSISAAYLTPFFVEHGLSTAQIFLLQSIFSAAYLLWEIPSGMIADRLGRALSIKISAPIAVTFGSS